MIDAADTELVNLCNRVKEYLGRGKYKECMQDICYSMYLYPDAPEPHNLMGILLKKQKNHTGAIKHFRAALDLDPSYLPARENMMDYARGGSSIPECRFCFADCTD